MTDIIVDIAPRVLYSAYIDAPFDKGKEALEKEGYRIISLRENAQLRMQEGKGAFVSTSGNWVKEGVLYIQNKGAFLTKDSPVMANAVEATSCHRSGAEFYLSDAQVQESLADSVKLSRDSIPTNRFAENPITVYAFGDLAEQYGQFLQDSGIESMPVWLANPQDKPFARQLWFHRLVGDSRSGLSGYNWDLDYDSRVRGVRQGGEATAKNLEART